ncbi:hypothetical protein CPB84DRAFT_1687784, partial [Gymnopilus junonius]
CENELANAQGGSLCEMHQIQLAGRCLVRDCMNGRVEGTNACETHQPQWQNFKKFNSHQVAS